MGNTDYQNQMKGETLQADKAGNQAAAEFSTVAGAAGTPTFGLVPGGAIPLDHAIERQQYFRKEIERTVKEGPDVPFQDDESIKSSYVMKTQKEMLANYTSDINILPGADSAFNQFAPLANMAATAVAKTDQVGAQLQITTNDQTSQFLDAKHMKALKTAVVAEKMDKTKSVTAAAGHVSAKRDGISRATNTLKVILNEQVITKLNAEITTATTGKEDIEKKIAKVVKWVGYAEKGAALIAGGAGALAGGTAATFVEATPALAGDATMGAVKTGAGYAEKGAGYAGKVVGEVMQLYYADQMRAFEATITGAKAEIAGWDMANAALALQAAMDGVKEAAKDYKGAVDAYHAALDDRRMHMAAAGSAADKAAGGKDQKNSMAMLWISSVMESKTMLGAAMEAGTNATERMNDVGTQVSAHRNHGWAKIEDIWGQSGGADRTEASGTADLKALGMMRRTTQGWMAGAKEADGYLSKSVGDADKGTGEAGTLAKSGYSGDY
jgi:hypothetical protein